MLQLTGFSHQLWGRYYPHITEMILEKVSNYPEVLARKGEVRTEPRFPMQNPPWFFVLFFFKFIYLFIYFWLCWVFVSVRGLSLVAASGGHSSSRCAGLSLSRPLVAEHRLQTRRLSSCGARA